MAWALFEAAQGDSWEDTMQIAKYSGLRATTALCTVMVAALAANGSALAQNADESEDADFVLDEIVVTGSRIVRTELTATSPVFAVDQVQLRLDRAQTIEDIQQKLPQSAAGANSTGAAVGDSLGSSTIDLRGLGQNRTLVLINGTRAVPFSFRNAVDLNSIPAGLIKRVEVLTGGAAAIYGADAVAGVVNFIMDDEFDGMEASFSYEIPQGGGETFTAEGIFGGEIGGGRGHVTAYVGYTERQELLASARDFTANAPTLIASTGGNFTDVATGNFFAFDDLGNFSTTRQTVDVTPDRFLIFPIERFSAGAFFKYDLFEDNKMELYGRAMYTEVRVTSAGATGQTPVVVNEQVSISSDNPFLPATAANLLTFDASGQALVNVERNLGLGLQFTETDRDTIQVVAGLRGDLGAGIKYDVYGQYGRTEGNSTVFNDGIRNTAAGASRFAAIANTVDIFGPDADLSSLTSPLEFVFREREQKLITANLSGNSAEFFELPSGPISFALGYEYREEVGIQRPGAAIANGQDYRLNPQGAIDASFDANEIYGEILIPVLKDVQFVKDLSVEGAYRISDYSNTGQADTWKVGLSWTVSDDIRFRFTRQTAIRAPNLGEFAGPEVGLPLSLFDPDSPDLIPRLLGRFDGDPCLDGRGDQAQCDRLGAAAPGTPFDTSAAVYSFGGNANINPETATTYTIGAVITPTAVEGLNATIDFYSIEIRDAVSQIQPIAALTNCYIDNPVEGNPLCGAVLRDPVTGLISQALVNDFNLAVLKQEGFDVGVTYGFDSDDLGGSVRFAYQGNIVTSQSRQANATVAAIDCKGTFGGSCSGDFASFLQADYRHRLTVDWANDDLNVQVGWRMIGGVTNALDETDTIGAQHYIDLGATWQAHEMLELTVGVDNLFDINPPVPASGGNHFGALSDYDILGRTIGFSVRIRG